jgi:hypothetical protein
MTDKKPCNHDIVLRHINDDNGPADKWTCTVCGATFYHLEDIGFPGQNMVITEAYATLRDQFAMAAMQSILVIPVKPEMVAMSLESARKNVSRWSYEWADAMLEARKS